MEVTSLCESDLMKYQNPDLLLRFCQSNPHEFKNIHDQLKSRLESLDYQLRHILIPLKKSFLYHQWNISSLYQYHIVIIIRTWPRNEYDISDHLSS